MLAVEKWAQDKNSALAFFAINHALIAREKSEALRHIKERRLYGYIFPLPDFTSWFSMYQSRKPLLAYKRLMVNSPAPPKEVIALMIAFRKLIKSPKLAAKIKKKLTPKDIEDSEKYFQEMCLKTYAHIREEIEKPQSEMEAKSMFLDLLKTDELTLGFYFLVYAPCLLYFGMTPNAIYQSALKRDISAIEKLLKIDPLILHDPAIGYQIQSVRLYGKINDYDLILNAITKQPKISYKNIADERRSIKSDHGAQILVLSKAMKHPLLVPQLRELYDKLATDYDCTLIDTDIKKPEGFDKTVKLKAATWQKQLQNLEKQI